MTGTGIVIDHINLNQQGCCFRRVTDFDPWHLACHEQLLEKCLEFIETVMLLLDGAGNITADSYSHVFFRRGWLWIYASPAQLRRIL